MNTDIAAQSRISQINKSQTYSMLKSYKDFQNQKLNIDNQIFLKEAENLRNYEHQITQMRKQITTYRNKALDTHKRLKSEMDQVMREKEAHEKSIQDLKKINTQDQANIASIKKKYLDLCKQRISIANNIDSNAIKKLHMDDRRSDAHDLFKWIIITFYKQPVSKYYWDNFRQQVFKEDKGHDFKERLGKVSAADIKQEQRVATESLLKNKQKYIDHPQFASIKEEIKKLVKIADLIMIGNQLSKDLTIQQREIDKRSGDSKTKEDLAHKCILKTDATKQRVDINDRYIVILDEIDQSLALKEAAYSLAANQGHKIIEQLRNNQPNFLRNIQTPLQAKNGINADYINGQHGRENETVGSKPNEASVKPTSEVTAPPLQQPKQQQYNTQAQKRDECACTVF